MTLTRNWDTSDNANDLDFINTKLLLTSGTVPNLDMETWTDADSDSNSKGLPWLACFGYEDDGSGNGTTVSNAKGTFPSVVERRQQIAANLKDYCDTDLRPTSDIDPKNWKTTEPNFTGNEKTPYINEVGIKVSAVVSITPTTAPKNNVRADVYVMPYVELAYIYQDSWTTNLQVYIEGSVKIKTTNGSKEETKDYSLNTSIPINGTYNNGYSNFSCPAASSDSKSSSTVERTSTNVSVEVISYQIDKIIIHNNTATTPIPPLECYDYTKKLTGSKTINFTVSNVSPLKTAWLGFACHDPRHNLHASEWEELTPDSMVSTTAPTTVFSITSAYAGQPNPVAVPNAGGADIDPETTSDPVKISTTFFRNGPMESPWELGFIHRGARWQTINLKKYDSSKAFSPIDIGGKKYLAGGGLYADGDANILDQIKMTPKAKSPQKIKLLSSRIKNFEALFSKIKLGCTIDNDMTVSSIASGGTPSEFSSTQETYFGNKVITKYSSTVNQNTRRTRSSVVDILTLPDILAPPAPGGITATTDATQEELIGKIVNLTEVSGKLSGFTVVILAQTIKDVGGPSGNPINITKYSNDSTSDSDTRPCETGVFNAKINDPDNSNKNIYYDEITAEQKVLARCYRDVDGTIKVTSIKYVE